MHEPFQAPDNPTALNFPPYQRQIFRSVFESLTQEEVNLLFHTIRNCGKATELFKIIMRPEVNKLFHVLRAAFQDADIATVTGEAQAYKYGWEKMRKYRETGVP